MSNIVYTYSAFEELSLERLYAIMRLRQEVFVVEQNCPYLDADDKDQHSLHVLGLDENKNLQCYARLLPEGISYDNYASIGRILTGPYCRGTGEGARLMAKSIEICQEKFSAPIKISAQVYAIPFYERFGFVTVGEEYLEDDIPHIGMVL